MGDNKINSYENKQVSMETKMYLGIIKHYQYSRQCHSGLAKPMFYLLMERPIFENQETFYAVNFNKL